MKTLQDYRNDFLKKAREFDTGKSEEDFHSYLRQNNLEHHLSETQIQDRNRENNSLNGLGLVAGIAIPLTFGAIFGMNKLMKNNMGVFKEPLIRDIDTLSGRIIEYPNTATDSISGINTRPMPTAPNHIGQDITNFVGLKEPDEGVLDISKLRENMSKRNVENVGGGFFKMDNNNMVINPRTGKTIMLNQDMEI